MTRTVGAVTIGQAPRIDVVPEMLEYLGSGFTFVEAGALDDLSDDEIAALAPVPGDYVFVSRMRDGSSATMAERHLLPLVKRKVEHLFAEGLNLVVLLCTGEFPHLDVPGMLILPQELVYAVAHALGKGKRVGVVCPLTQQIPQVTNRWQTLFGNVIVKAASPYADGVELAEATQSLRIANVDMVVLDCIGYTASMQSMLQAQLNVPVILPRALVAAVIKSLY